VIFDRYITVDWSASNVPKFGKDSVWICDLGSEGEGETSNPRTRGSAEATIRQLLLDAVQRKERVLIGFDFPYAYPRGFAAALGLPGPAWSAIWRYLEEHLQDDAATNASNRFEVASVINARLTDHAFWGRPATQRFDHLSQRRDEVRYRIEGEAAGLAEWREVERLLRSRKSYPQQTWKLAGAGSVGSQALTGIPVLARLRWDPELRSVSTVWSFEVLVPDLPAGEPAIVHAEIWPSLAPTPVAPGQVRDQTQVLRLAEEFRMRDQSGSLSELLAAPGPEAAEEGWILGVESGSVSGVDPVEVYGVAPAAPVPIWGWGSIPDQYGRRTEDDTGEDE
jgi:precorrin-8X/cobalt-precorrin-8 methylmutase